MVSSKSIAQSVRENKERRASIESEKSKESKEREDAKRRVSVDELQDQIRQNLAKEKLEKAADQMVSLLTQFRQAYPLRGDRDAILPLVCYAEVFVHLGLSDIASTIDLYFDAREQKNLQQLLTIDPTKTCMKVTTSLLTRLDSDARIKGKLAPLYQNEQVLIELMDLVTFYEHHPPRSEILYHEPAELDADPRGSLREEVVKGRVQFLLSIDIFLEYMVVQVTGRSTPKVPQLSPIMDQIWKAVDTDGDETLSHEESRELTRVILSRPVLGKLLITMVCADPANSSQLPSWCKTDAGKQRLVSFIPAVIRTAAAQAHATAAEMWSQMDEDGNLEIDKDEFCKLFPAAFTSAFAAPLARILLDHVKKQHVDLQPPSSSKQESVKQRNCFLANGDGFINIICGGDGRKPNNDTNRFHKVPVVPNEFDEDEAPMHKNPDDPVFRNHQDVHAYKEHEFKVEDHDDITLEQCRADSQACANKCSIM